jgi:hypothetical protein
VKIYVTISQYGESRLKCEKGREKRGQMWQSRRKVEKWKEKINEKIMINKRMRQKL